MTPRERRLLIGTIMRGVGSARTYAEAERAIDNAMADARVRFAPARPRRNTTPMTTALARRIMAMRVEHPEMSQEQIAAHFGVDRKRVSDVEGGHHEWPGIGHRRRGPLRIVRMDGTVIDVVVR